MSAAVGTKSQSLYTGPTSLTALILSSLASLSNDGASRLLATKEAFQSAINATVDLNALVPADIDEDERDFIARSKDFFEVSARDKIAHTTKSALHMYYSDNWYWRMFVGFMILLACIIVLMCIYILVSMCQTWSMVLRVLLFLCMILLPLVPWRFFT
jgi:hypothetical protein